MRQRISKLSQKFRSQAFQPSDLVFQKQVLPTADRRKVAGLQLFGKRRIWAVDRADLPNLVVIESLTDERADSLQRFRWMEHEILEADFYVVRTEGPRVAPARLHLPHPVQRGNKQAVVPIPGKGTNELLSVQSQGDIASISHYMNEERFWNLPFDVGNVQEIVRPPYRPALVSAGSRHLVHHGAQEVAAVPDRSHHSFRDLAGIQTGTPELPAAKPKAHQLAPDGDTAKVPEPRNQQIENHRFSPVNREMPRRQEHVIQHGVPGARGTYHEHRGFVSGRHSLMALVQHSLRDG